MAHVIGEPCIGVKDASCVAVCPVACIFDAGPRFQIDAQTCIDCGACVVVCPVSAIAPAGRQPTEWRLDPQTDTQEEQAPADEPAG